MSAFGLVEVAGSHVSVRRSHCSESITWAKPAKIVFAGAGVKPGSAISHIPRPCVAMRNFRSEVIPTSKTATRGSPVPIGVQVAPPSSELYTPMSVPAIRRFEFAGSITNALTGTCGTAVSPEPLAGVQLGDVRLVVFQMLVTPKAESVT